MRLRLPRIPFFRIFYSGTFTLFTLLLIALLLISPGDHIYQSFQSGQLYHIVIVGAVYVLTFILAVFIYAGRLFSTRSALAGIPREWSLGGSERNLGIGLGMGRRMGAVVREGLDKSAIITYEGRPRDLRGERVVRHISGKKDKRRNSEKGARRYSVEGNAEPVWGTISHAGWASPESPDFPNLHFELVIAELGHLIEAKAVSLAPVDPSWDAGGEKEEAVGDEAPLPDPFVVELLRRPIAMSLREYFQHLTSLDVMTKTDLGPEFLSMYEQSRFGFSPLKEDEFRTLMAIFAEILRSMQPLDPQVVENFRAAAAEELLNAEAAQSSDDGQSFLSEGTTRHTPLPCVYSSASSVASHSNTHATLHTAPSRPGNSRSVSDMSRASQSSTSSVSHPGRRPSRSTLRSAFSQRSFSAKSVALSEAGSVIRLSEAKTPLDLPYAFANSSEEDV